MVLLLDFLQVNFCGRLSCLKKQPNLEAGPSSILFILRAKTFRACLMGGGGITRLLCDMLQSGVLHGCVCVKRSVCIYIYIYTHAGELVLVPLF